jgi:hypothetical protein
MGWRCLSRSCSRFDDSEDVLEDVVHPVHDFQITESQYLDALLLKMECSSSVMDLLGCCVVLAAIQFDRQFQLGAVEVQDVGRAGELAAEFEVGDLSGAEFLPEQVFAVGLLGA